MKEVSGACYTLAVDEPMQGAFDTVDDIYKIANVGKAIADSSSISTVQSAIGSFHDLRRLAYKKIDSEIAQAEAEHNISSEDRVRIRRETLRKFNDQIQEFIGTAFSQDLIAFQRDDEVLKYIRANIGVVLPELYAWVGELPNEASENRLKHGLGPEKTYQHFIATGGKVLGGPLRFKDKLIDLQYVEGEIKNHFNSDFLFETSTGKWHKKTLGPSRDISRVPDDYNWSQHILVPNIRFTCINDRVRDIGLSGQGLIDAFEQAQQDGLSPFISGAFSGIKLRGKDGVEIMENGRQEGEGFIFTFSKTGSFQFFRDERALTVLYSELLKPELLHKAFDYYQEAAQELKKAEKKFEDPEGLEIKLAALKNACESHDLVSNLF